MQESKHERDKRLNEVFPVHFQFLDEFGQPAGRTYEGFTRNVAKGGLSIQSYLEKGKDSFDFIDGKTKLKLAIGVPVDIPPVDSIVTVKWSSKIPEGSFDTYFFGVHYDQIGNAQQRMLERHIKRQINKPRVFVYFSLLFTALVIVFTYILLVKR